MWARASIPVLRRLFITSFWVIAFGLNSAWAEKGRTRKLAQDTRGESASSRFKDLVACKDLLRDRAQPDRQQAEGYIACARPFFSTKITEHLMRQYSTWLMMSGDAFEGPDACAPVALEEAKKDSGVDEVLCFSFTAARRTSPGMIYFVRDSGVLSISAIKY